MLLIYTGYGFLTHTHAHTHIAKKFKCKVTDFTGNNTLLLESVNIGPLLIRARAFMGKNAKIYKEEIHMKK